MAKLRHSLSLTQAEFAQRIAMTEVGLRRIERLHSASVFPKTLRNIASLMGVTPPEAAEKLRPENGHSLPTGIDPKVINSDPIPTWDLDITASAWIDVPPCHLDENDPDQQRVIATGKFRLRIIGHCMEPHYSSGMIVEFQIVRWDQEALVVGRDYVICRSDGMSTFKRLVGANEDEIKLAATNQKDFPGTLTVPRQEVCRVAKVVGRMLPPPPEEPVKIAKARR